VKLYDFLKYDFSNYSTYKSIKVIRKINSLQDILFRHILTDVEETYNCFSKKLCNLQYATTYLFLKATVCN